MFKAMDYISHHLDDNPGLDEVAAAAAISTFHFHRISPISPMRPVVVLTSASSWGQRSPLGAS
ncbi:hypothetical protein [Aeromonas veronii]|uniref:hypothetical protein n=1 Tax=Aeromonas veronii TaxID=654 RepID=UPI001F34A95D|nr:hypothetical protein [Aeromonas veronii]